jgi:hypothetical protein
MHTRLQKRSGEQLIKIMNIEIKSKWIEALRSGDYPQGIGWLKDDSGRFCCLGVLCDVVDPENREKWIGETILPSSVSVEADLEQTGRLKRSVGAFDRLVDLNDTAGFNFNQIANVIEEQF